MDNFKQVLVTLLNLILSKTDGWIEHCIETLPETSRKYFMGMIKGK